MKRVPLLTAIVIAASLVTSAAATTAPRSRPVPVADSTTIVAMLSGVTNGACPVPGVATGGQPAANHLQALAKGGFRTVLDLRTAEEARGFDEPGTAKRAGLEYVSVPFMPATLGDAQFDRVREVLKRTDGRGVFVHCASANRVNAVLVPWLVLDRGWPLDRAMALAKANGLRSPEMESKARDYVSRKRNKG
jgi:protein tyrosine phosphatase (PTP) superfamily phosphohydrolase (DUF442 family)